ncbi:hypothetical protein CPB85DRAFT_1479475 [Mucidula mucida]|nr:hypothetical protein CPB85DRAFT_1479475 [Mucidula mucida]
MYTEIMRVGGQVANCVPIVLGLASDHHHLGQTGSTRYLDCQIRKCNPLPHNIEELWATLVEEWVKLDIGYITKLYKSMPCRVGALLKAKGKYTKLLINLSVTGVTKNLAKIPPLSSRHSGYCKLFAATVVDSLITLLNSVENIKKIVLKTLAVLVLRCWRLEQSVKGGLPVQDYPSGARQLHLSDGNNGITGEGWMIIPVPTLVLGKMTQTAETTSLAAETKLLTAATTNASLAATTNIILLSETRTTILYPDPTS